MTGGQGSMSKLKGGDVAVWATRTCMDLVGPYAQTTKCPLEKFFRDAKIYQLFEGTAEIQRMVISRMQATEYRERLKQGVEVAAEAIAASGSGNGAHPSGDDAGPAAGSENGAGLPAEKQAPSAA
jgi:Acyl-CoA dehydrogenase, C-terminal domain